MFESKFSDDLRRGIEQLSASGLAAAADSIARSFATPVDTSTACVYLLETDEILMALAGNESGFALTVVSQPFFSKGISGEVLLVFNDANMDAMFQLMGCEPVVEDHLQPELVLEMASLMNAACVQGICSQLDMKVLMKQPVLLGQNTSIKDIFSTTKFTWRQTLAIECKYTFTDYAMGCDLMVLLHETSLPLLFSQVPCVTE